MGNVAKGRMRVLIVSAMCCCLVLAGENNVWSSQEEPIAKLKDIQGTVLIKSQGLWGLEAVEGMDLYADDRVVTKDGQAAIKFPDRTRITVDSNSNLLIEQQYIPATRLKTPRPRRRLFLLAGRMSFRTPDSKWHTEVATPTLVCGVRPNSFGNLSLDAQGINYLQFDDGDARFIIGMYEIGLASPVSENVAQELPLQKAALRAWESAHTARMPQISRELDVSEDLLSWLWADAREASAQETMVMATEVYEMHPDPCIYKPAEKVVEKARLVLAESKRIKEASGIQPEPGALKNVSSKKGSDASQDTLDEESLSGSESPLEEDAVDIGEDDWELEPEEEDVSGDN